MAIQLMHPTIFIGIYNFNFSITHLLLLQSLKFSNFQISDINTKSLGYKVPGSQKAGFKKMSVCVRKPRRKHDVVIGEIGLKLKS